MTHPQAKEHVLEVFRAVPARWLTESVIANRAKQLATTEIPPHQFRAALDWQVSNAGNLETKIDSGLEERVWRLTDSGKAALGLS